MAIETYRDVPVITVAELIAMLQALPQELQVASDDGRGYIGIVPPELMEDPDDGTKWVCI